MAFFDPTEITFSGDELRDINEINFEKQIKNPALESLTEIDEGIKADKQIVFMSQLNGLFGAGSGECEPGESSNGITSSEKLWSPKTISDRLGFCWKDIYPSFLSFTKKEGIEAADITDFVQFMTDKVLGNALAETVFRSAWFSQETPTELTAGLNPVYFNRFNGLWHQLMAIGAADPDRITSGLDTRNAGATYAEQKFTPQDTTDKVVMNTLSDMVTDADLTLRQQEGLQFEVTQTVFDQYVKELKFANIQYTTERIEGGLTAVDSDGYNVVAVPWMDKNIKTNYNDGTKLHLPHRAILANKENLRIGTESESTFSQFDIFYDKKDKKVYVDFQFDMDAKVVFDTEVQLAY